MRRSLVAVFVGGASRRMAGFPKGRLPSPRVPGCTLVEATVEAAASLELGTCLVGNHRAYDDLVPLVPRVPDRVDVPGPLGGLLAAYDHAASPGIEAEFLLTVGCDHPYVTSESLARLLALEAAGPVVAYRRSVDGPPEPFFARWQIDESRLALEALAASGVTSLVRAMRCLGAVTVLADEVTRSALADWDTAEDIRTG